MGLFLIKYYFARLFDSVFLQKFEQWRKLFLPQVSFVGSAIDVGLIAFAAEDEGRTEEPTQRRREKEREKGRVPKSQEVASSLVALGGLLMLFLTSGHIVSGLAKIMKKYLGGFNDMPMLNVSELILLLSVLIREVGAIIAPILIAVFVLALVGNLSQVGFLFTLKPLKPDFSRIKLDFQTMAKKVFFSKQVAVNLIKTILKVILLGSVAYFVIMNDITDIFKSSELGVGETLNLVGNTAFKLAVILSIILVVLSIPDYIFQRLEFTESIKMTREEVKQEHRETEGDPYVKQRQRQRSQEIVNRNMLSEVPKADVIITNPTHFAVAMRYDAEFDKAPRVLAKGADQLAFKIREIAKEYNIPIIENKPLAQELYASVEIGSEVPYELFSFLVEIFKNLESMQSRLSGIAS